jgi:hypothetical protein
LGNKVFIQKQDISFDWPQFSNIHKIFEVSEEPIPYF